MPKVWLVTGSSRTLGRALAEAVLDAGDLLVATARRPEELAGLADRHGDRVRVVDPDAVSPAAAHAAVAAAIHAFGRLDVVVNNPGYTNVGSIEQTPLEELEAQIATDFWGPVRVAHAALPAMRAQRCGRIVQLSMAGARRAGGRVGAYEATARGLEGFAEALAGEVAPLGISVMIAELGALRPAGAPADDPAAVAAEIVRAAGREHPPMRLRLAPDGATPAESGACSLRCEPYGRQGGAGVSDSVGSAARRGSRRRPG